MQLFLGKDHENDFIDVDWTVLTFCNYKCDYCYARNSKSIKWNQILTKEKIDECFYAFEQSKHKIILNVLGGEPTLHPNIDYIIECAYNCCKISRIAVITNNSRLIKLPKTYNKLLVVCTYHPSTVKNENTFLKNLEYYTNLGIETRVSIMADDRFLEKTNQIYDKLENTKAEIEISYIINNNNKPEKNSLKKPNLKNYSFNGNLFSIDEIYKNNLNNFKGWKCKRGYLFINIDGKITGNCFNYNKNIFKDKTFFKNFDPPFLNCDKDVCLFDCFIAQPKVLK